MKNISILNISKTHWYKESELLTLYSKNYCIITGCKKVTEKDGNLELKVKNKTYIRNINRILECGLKVGATNV